MSTYLRRWSPIVLSAGCLLLAPGFTWASATAPATVTLTGPSGAVPAGASIRWTAETSSKGSAAYEFWTETPSGARSIVQSYSSNSSLTWTVPSGKHVLGVTVKLTTKTGSSTDLASKSIDGLASANLGRVTSPVDTLLTLDGGATHRFWLENPVGEWITLGAFSSAATGWTPRFPGKYQVVSMIKAKSGAIKVTRKTVEVVDRAHALVALGDSVSFGWDLGNNWNPYPGAFPYLIGKSQNLLVDDLAYPGWTTENLLTALSTKEYTQALATAPVVTIDIGNNDLLQPAAKDGLLDATRASAITTADIASLEADITTMGSNLTEILADVRHDAPTAKIIVYNLYDPIASSTSLLGVAAIPLVSGADVLIAKDATAANVPLVNAYSAFAGHQAAYVQAENFHPTIAGQLALAKIGEAALAADSSTQ